MLSITELYIGTITFENLISPVALKLLTGPFNTRLDVKSPSLIRDFLNITFKNLTGAGFGVINFKLFKTRLPL